MVSDTSLACMSGCEDSMARKPVGLAGPNPYSLHPSAWSPMAAGNTSVSDVGLSSGFTDGCYDPYNTMLYMTSIWAATNGILQHDITSETWKFQDLTEFSAEAKGYHGGVATGKHVYFAPRQDSLGTAHGVVARLSVSGDFNSSGSWSFFDLSTISANYKGYAGALFDGRYVYFIPENNGSPSGRIVRYDTLADFASSVAWAGINLSATGFSGGVFDGRYIYLCPRANPSAHGNMMRFDTLKPFLSSNFETYNTTGITFNCKGYAGPAAFDGRYVYFAPINNGSPHGNVVRYDTWKTFTSLASWETVDISSFDASWKGFFGCLFDGRYVYFAPYNNGAYHGNVVRYDTGLPFTSSSSWSSFDVGGIDSAYKGYAGVLTDGRRVYLVPYQNPVGLHGNVARLSTKAGESFTRPRGWNTSGPVSLERSTPLTRMVTAYTENVTHHAGAVDAGLGAWALLVQGDTLYAAVGHVPALRDGACIQVATLPDIEAISFQYEILEQGVNEMHLYDDKVYIPGVDEIEGGAGNYYIGDNGTWTKKQVVTLAAHIFGACHDDLGRLYLAGAVGSSIPDGDQMWDTENEGIAVNAHGTSVAGYRCFSVLARSSEAIYVVGNTAANETSGVLIYATTFEDYSTQVADVVPATRCRMVRFGNYAICVDVSRTKLWRLSSGVGLGFDLPFTVPAPNIIGYAYATYNAMVVDGAYLYVLGTTGVWRTPDLIQWEQVLSTGSTVVLAFALWRNRIIYSDVGTMPRIYMTNALST